MTSRRTKCHVSTTIVMFLVFASAAEGGDPVRGERLFRITRNKNDNIVCYDVLLKNGRLDTKNPVSVYWVIPSANNKLESLNFLERTRAYGISVVKAYGEDSVDVTLKSAKRPIRVSARGSRWIAVTSIDSREIILDSVYVMADESSTTPTVKWADILGRDGGTGESIRKRITK